MRVKLGALGCRLNEAELQMLATELAQAGHEICAPGADDGADLVVLNTCAVTGEAARKSRQRVRQLQRRHPGAQLVVTGCQATLEPRRVPEGVVTVDNQDKDRLFEVIAERVGLERHLPQAANATQVLSRRGRTRAFVKVQDGCRHQCAYCIVTVARGEERSRTVPDLVEQVQGLAAEGVAEIVLAGVHVGGYGRDVGSDLTSLVRALLDDTDIPRIRFASVEPWDIPPRFFALFDDDRVMPHMHLPAQSGSDSVLKRMFRRGTAASFEALVDLARARDPGFNVTTDVIVGFPGETDAEFDETVAFCERVGFGHIHVFPFSAREGTRAAALSDVVDDATKQARTQRLIALSDEQTRARLAAQVGSTQRVLVEGGGTQGYTDAFFPVHLEGAAGTSGVHPVVMQGVYEGGDRMMLHGRLAGGGRRLSLI